MNQGKCIAIYLRISKKEKEIDSQKITNQLNLINESDSKESSSKESNSIESQRQLLYDYITKNSIISTWKTMEYCDDGYTGTNFNRPAIQKLLKDIQNNQIQGIIVKDFSRFGRNYLEVGEYLEKIFPSFSIRFLSVNDCYDSENNHQSVWLQYAFKNIINDYYSRDISKKVKTALKSRKEKGLFMGVVAPYGYEKSEDVKGKLVIDQEASEIIKEIFALRMKGYTLLKIAEELNNQGVPTPLEYKRLREDKACNNETALCENQLSQKRKWTVATISRIVNNPMYTGSMINARFKVEEVGSKKKKLNKRQDWIIVPNTHEAIIDEDTYEKAHNITQFLSLENTIRE